MTEIFLFRILNLIIGKKNYPVWLANDSPDLSINNTV